MKPLDVIILQTEIVVKSDEAFVGLVHKKEKVAL